MRQSILCMSVSAVILGSGLSGCASLQTKWFGVKSSGVTLPSDMSKAAYLPIEETDYEPQIVNAVWDEPLESKPVIIELFDKGPSLTGYQAVSYANREAVMKPKSDNYLNAIQLYPYAEGSLYQVYASPSQVTDIALEKGEGLITVSAGDTQRWTVGDTVSGSGPNEQVHILVKPMEANLSTNAIITSTKRTYYLDLKSFADTYMAAVSWRYPAEAIKRFFAPRMEEPQLINASFTLAEAMPSEEDMRFDYIIKGDTPRWRPTRVFDDGAKVFIEFPEGLAVSEAPPLFVTDQNGKNSRLVNYRVKDAYYVVDRLFEAAELRLGEKSQTVVRIERQL